MPWALPERETRGVERAASACLALVLLAFSYGVVQQLPVALWRARPLPDLPVPVLLLILLAGAPFVLEAALLFTASLPRARRPHVAGALVLVVVAIVLAPHSFFQRLPDPLVTPLVFHTITELALLSLLGAVCLVLPRAAWWAFALAVAHAVVQLRMEEIFVGPTLAPGWYLMADGTLFASLVLLAALAFRRVRAGGRAA